MGETEGQELEMKGKKVGSDGSRRVQQLQQVQRRRAVGSVKGQRTWDAAGSRRRKGEKHDPQHSQKGLPGRRRA